MAGEFKLEITAVDKATAVFRKLGASVDKAMRPAAKVQKTLDSIGSGGNLVKRQRELDSVAKSLAGVARVAESAGLRIPLLGGLGGGFAIGAGITGFVEAMRESSAQATKVLRFQQQHGMSMREIQRLTAAAGREGLDEDSARETIGGFGARLNDMAAGRDGGIGRMLLRRAGVELKKNADGSPDTNQALLDLADAIKRQPNPEAAGFLAGQFGLTSLLPVLQKGSAAIRKAGDDAERTGQVMSQQGVKALDDYGRAWDRLAGSIKGVRNSGTGGSASTLAPGIDTLAGGIEKATENSGKRGFLDTLLLPLRTLVGAIEMGQSMADVTAPGRRKMSGVVTEIDGSPMSQFGSGMKRIGGGPSEYKVDPAEQRDRDGERLRILRDELAKEQDPSIRSALTREIASTQAGIDGPTSAPGSQPGAGGGFAQQRVQVEVSVGDERSRVKTTTSGGGQAPATRIAYSMPGSGVR